MNITEYAIAKKLFGGGGSGKREGTAIPVGVPIDRIYFNINNTPEETDAILSQLTYVEGAFDLPVYAACACTTDGNIGTFIAVFALDGQDAGHYSIMLFDSLTTLNQVTIYYSGAAEEGWQYNSWIKGDGFRSYPGYDTTVNSLGVNMPSLTELMGLPVGAENEKIKNVLSVTPF